MTPEQFLLERADLKDLATPEHDSLNDTIWTNNVLRYMQEYADFMAKSLTLKEIMVAKLESDKLFCIAESRAMGNLDKSESIAVLGAALVTIEATNARLSSINEQLNHWNNQ